MLLIFTVFSLTSMTYASSPTVILDGHELYFDTPPTIENGRTLVPFRAIFEALGADVTWNPTTQAVTARKGNLKITLWIDDNIFLRNSETCFTDVPPKIVYNRTMVPLRVISEALGADVSWDDYSQTVFINSPNEDYYYDTEYKTAYIRGLYEDYDGSTYLDIDFINFYFRDEAYEKAIKDGYSREEIENEYYIGNDDETLTTLKLSEDVEIYRWYYDGTTCLNNEWISLQEFKDTIFSIYTYYSPFHIEVKNGEIVKITQQYTP